MKPTIRLGLLCIALSLSAHAQEAFLAGTGDGLYRIGNGRAERLWQQAEVRRIERTADSWVFLTGGGVFASRDLKVFEDRNGGLPVKLLKIPGEGKRDFRQEVQGLMDLALHPRNPLVMATATKDAVYLTRDGGLTWGSEGTSALTAGIKAVAVLDLPDRDGVPRTTVLMSHPIYGVSWRQGGVPGSRWTDINDGLEKMPSIKWPDEVSDFHAVAKDGSVELYASQTFMPRVYRLDWANKRWVPVWSGPGRLGTVDGLAAGKSSLVFASADSIREISLDPAATGASTGAAVAQPARDAIDIRRSLAPVTGVILSAWVPPAFSGGRGSLSLSELWLLSPSRQSSRFSAAASGKKGNYLPVHQVTTDAGLDAHLDTLRKNGLNMLVVDMKDDKGFLRYNPKDPLVIQKGRQGRGIDVERFVERAKASGVYLVARIVVFKDQNLARFGGAKYAVWDRREQKAWQGYEVTTRKIETAVPTDETAAQGAESETTRKYYEEYWVDPYSEEVWEYNVAVARELIERGFDEIQFDYIRFPTDGANLSDATYRWQDRGMDKESALMSFLSYARREIEAPISIDIYGANGWYRTGSRTGQDIELLARYVDVICPMFYPSHFEQGFLAQEPARDRPYRIYLHGSYRNAVIARNHCIVRPWAQAFYLNVSYDRAFYNEDYVQRQAFGVRDSINQGYTYWNNSGRYSDLRPDIDLAAPYPWEPPVDAPAALPFFGAARTGKEAR